MYKILFLVGVGGLIGSVARYLVGGFFARIFPSTFHYGTFVVNVLGCLIIGVVYGLYERHYWLAPEWKLFLATGFCGGFTTFSTFAHENVKHLQNGNYLYFFAYSVGSFVLGMLAVLLGLFIVKQDI